MVILNKITELLQTSGRQQKDLCEYLGVSAKVYSQWKSGQTTSYKKYLPQIADYLGVTVDYLTGKSSIPNAIEASNIYMIPVFESVVRLFSI